MSRTQEDIQDELLVLRCQDGDGEALRTLIARWQPRLARLAWRLTAEREAARDVVQETWLAIVHGLRRLDDPARFGPWAYRIVTNKCTDWTRRRIVRRNAAGDLQHLATMSHGESEYQADSNDELDRLRRAMNGLPEDQRAILSLHYLDGMRIGDIARVLALRPGTIKSRLHHARTRLKQALERVKP